MTRTLVWTDAQYVCEFVFTKFIYLLHLLLLFFRVHARAMEMSVGNKGLFQFTNNLQIKGQFFYP